MLDQLNQFIHQNQLFNPSDRLLVAVSGGVDSVVLATLLHQAGYSVVLAHCNFQLRGEESEKDEQLVRELAEKLSVALEVRRFATKEAVAESSDSLQMVARNLRYEWFETLKHKHQAHHLCTAHHLNDSFETVLLNLVKGTGIAGLAGIPLKANGTVRPLLFAEKEQIRAYAEQNGISWREDQSNQQDTYQRNLLRNQVIPLLRKINPSLEQTFERSSWKLRQSKEIVEEEIVSFHLRISTFEGGNCLVSIPKLLSEPHYYFKLLQWLGSFGFTHSQVNDLVACLSGESGRQFLSPSHELTKDREQLFIVPHQQTQSQPIWVSEAVDNVRIGNHQLTFDRLQAAQFTIPKEASIAGLDFETLRFPLLFRKWREGDRFQPLGMKGRKKVSDFLVDCKIPLNKKQQVWVMESDGEIAWVVGHRLAHPFRITKATERILRVELCK